MNRLKKIYWSLIIVLFCLAPVGFAVSEQIQFGPREAFILVDNLLGLSPKLSHKESLARYNQWANVYAKYSSKNLLTVNEMKIYLLIVFIAEERGIVHTQEEISEEVVLKFERQPEVFLAVLEDLPFLIPITCNVLKGHFLFIDQTDERHQFARKYKKIILQHLGEKLGSECLKEITKEIPGL